MMGLNLEGLQKKINNLEVEKRVVDNDLEKLEKEHALLKEQIVKLFDTDNPDELKKKIAEINKDIEAKVEELKALGVTLD